ncbi:cation transporter [Streptomyces sp. NPDC001675]
MIGADDAARRRLLRRGFALEYATLGWNVIGIVVLAVAAVSARSVALAGFGLDSLIEIGASTVVVWELSGSGEERRRRAVRLIGFGFGLLAVYLLVQSTWVLATGFRARHSALGIGWTAVTAAVMFALAAGKARTGAALDNPVRTGRPGHSGRMRNSNSGRSHGTAGGFARAVPMRTAPTRW